MVIAAHDPSLTMNRKKKKKKVIKCACVDHLEGVSSVSVNYSQCSFVGKPESGCFRDTVIRTQSYERTRRRRRWLRTDIEVVCIFFREGGGGRRLWVTPFISRGYGGYRVNFVYIQVQAEAPVRYL